MKGLIFSFSGFGALENNIITCKKTRLLQTLWSHFSLNRRQFILPNVPVHLFWIFCVSHRWRSNCNLKNKRLLDGIPYFEICLFYTEDDKKGTASPVSFPSIDQKLSHVDPQHFWSTKFCWKRAFFQYPHFLAKPKAVFGTLSNI